LDLVTAARDRRPDDAGAASAGGLAGKSGYPGTGAASCGRWSVGRKVPDLLAPPGTSPLRGSRDVHFTPEAPFSAFGGLELRF
jgi:hypothetical protein